jgi:hypothetical protein
MKTPNPYFLEYIFNDFNLTQHLENKYPGKKFYLIKKMFFLLKLLINFFLIISLGFIFIKI